MRHKLRRFPRHESHREEKSAPAGAYLSIASRYSDCDEEENRTGTADCKFGKSTPRPLATLSTQLPKIPIAIKAAASQSAGE